MRKEDIKKSFGTLEPNEAETKKMLNNILYYSDNNGKVSFMKAFNLKKVVPAFIIVLAIVGSIKVYDMVSNDRKDNLAKGSPEVATDLGGRGAQDSLALAQLKNQFQIGNTHYIILSDEQRAEFKFSSTINKSDIGEKLTTITTSVDESLKGCEVFKYIPAGGEAVVAVSKDNEYKLFKFLYFDSYIKNQDEDTSAYLKLYGINDPADIAKIQFIGHSDKAKIEGKTDIKAEITDTAKISEFYNYYSVIKNSSDKYFNKLFGQSNISNTNGTNIGRTEPAAPPPDQPGKQTGELPADHVNGSASDLPAKSVGTDSNKPVSNVNPTDIAQPSDAVKSVNPAEPPYRTKPSAGTEASYDRGSVSGTGSPVGSGSATAGSGTAPAGSVSSTGSAGSAAGLLNNSITIRIYNKSGVYFDAEYYPNIGFISRHEVNDSFTAFLKGYIG